MRFYLAAVFSILCLIADTGNAAENECGDWAGEVISTENGAEIRRAGEDSWTALSEGDFICLGDSLRLPENARAQVRIPGETELRFDDDGTYTFVPADDDSLVMLRITRGAVYIISRDPSALKVSTPFVNAGLEGTEFLVRADEENFELAVFEGFVNTDSETEHLKVTRQQRITTRSGVLTGPVTELSDRDDLLWALHYPLILYGPLPEPAEDISASSTDAASFAARAQSRIRLGRVAAARSDIARAEAISPDYPPALAIDATIALTAGDTGLAEQRVSRALARDPVSVPALIAQSYVLMHQGRLRDALTATEFAVQQEPGNPIAHARHAEALLAVSDVKGATAAANRALEIAPGLAEAHTVLGFAAMANGEFDPSVDIFETAIQLDSASPMPRIGLAIALNRLKQPQAGRMQIAAAVAMAANDSRVRSYMGKSYSDELRAKLAGSQFEIAGELDRADSTAPLYSSLFEETQNKPVDALANLKTAAAADNALAFRSTLYLDEDLMTRGTGIGPIYRNLGAEDLALLTAYSGLVAEPSNYSAHRLASDVFAEQPRRQVTRVNEAFQAQQLQPIGVLPSAPELALTNIYIADSVGPAALEHAQARSGFAQNGLSFETSGVVASNGTRGENAVVAGLFDNYSFNLGQYHHESDGFGDNNDYKQDAVSFHFQARVSAETSFQTELRSTRITKGDARLLFDSSLRNPISRQQEKADTVQFGALHRISPSSQIVGSLAVQRGRVLSDAGDLLASSVWGDGGIAEIQYIGTFEGWNVVGGLKAVRWNLRNLSHFSIVLPVPPFLIDDTVDVESHTRHLSSYVYVNRPLTDELTLTFGAATNALETHYIHESRISPKLGILWNPLPGTSLRAAAFRTMQGPIISRQLQQPTLEPMQVAGIGQFWAGAEGEFSENYELAIDHDLTDEIRLGGQHTERSVEMPYYVGGFLPSDVSVSTLYGRESIDNLRLFWTLSSKLAVSAGWQSEDFDYHGQNSPYGFSHLRTRRVPLEANIFINHAFSARVTGTRIRQRGQFTAPTPMESFEAGSSRFWTFDAALDIRLPKRRGSVEVAVKNLLDDNSAFQDTDPENPHVFPERFLLARFTLSY